MLQREEVLVPVGITTITILSVPFHIILFSFHGARVWGRVEMYVCISPQQSGMHHNGAAVQGHGIRDTHTNKITHKHTHTQKEVR